jgi:hypothetical protein
MQVAMVGVFLMFRRESERRNIDENRGTKLSSSQERKATVTFKMTLFWASFFFWTKRSVSFK